METQNTKISELEAERKLQEDLETQQEPEKEVLPEPVLEQK